MEPLLVIRSNGYDSVVIRSSGVVVIRSNGSNEYEYCSYMVVMI
jgi:hypothetical protein